MDVVMHIEKCFYSLRIALVLYPSFHDTGVILIEVNSRKILFPSMLKVNRYSPDMSLRWWSLSYSAQSKFYCLFVLAL